MAKPDDPDYPEKRIKHFREVKSKAERSTRRNLSKATPDQLHDASLKLKILDCLEEILEYIYTSHCAT